MRQHGRVWPRSSDAADHGRGLRRLQPYDHRRGDRLLAVLARRLQDQEHQREWDQQEERGGDDALGPLEDLLPGRWAERCRIYTCTDAPATLRQIDSYMPTHTYTQSCICTHMPTHTLTCPHYSVCPLRPFPLMKTPSLTYTHLCSRHLSIYQSICMSICCILLRESTTSPLGSCTNCIHTRVFHSLPLNLKL